MNNYDKYLNIFKEIFEVGDLQAVGLVYQEIAA